MDKSLRKLSLTVAVAMISFVAIAADLTQPDPLTDTEWDKVREHVLLLNNVSYVPSLLPLIMKHRDALGLSDDQKAAFRDRPVRLWASSAST